MNLNLKDAIAEVVRAGGSATPKRGTGEIVVSHPSMARRLVVNGRRKDSPRKLITFLNSIKRTP
jgi:hypothetical protein